MHWTIININYHIHIQFTAHLTFEFKQMNIVWFVSISTAFKFNFKEDKSKLIL